MAKLTNIHQIFSEPKHPFIDGSKQFLYHFFHVIQSDSNFFDDFPTLSLGFDRNFLDRNISGIHSNLSKKIHFFPFEALMI